MLSNNNVPIKYLLGKIKPEIIVVSIYGCFIVYLHDFEHVQNMSIPISIPAILGTTISLILGFRINQSYDRWWEARKVWGALVNDSRTLVRQVMHFIQSDSATRDAKEVVKQMANIQIAFNYALGRSLRGQDALEKIKPYLSDAHFEQVSKESNVPNALLRVHAQLLNVARENNWVDGFETIQIDNTLMRLTDSMGKAERIKNTVFPVTYTIIVEFLLYLFVTLLPLGMTDYFGYLVAPLMFIITLPFFLLEKTAIHLQQPFNNNKTDINVTAIATTIELNINNMLEQPFTPQPNPEDGDFYVM